MRLVVVLLLAAGCGTEEPAGEWSPPPRAASVGNVEVQGVHAYLTGTAGDSRGRLYVVNVEATRAPRLVGSFAHDAAVLTAPLSVRGDYLLLGSHSTLYVIDVSDPEDPVEIGSYENAGGITDVVGVGATAYLTDGGGLSVVDLSEPTAPDLLGRVPMNAVALDVLDGIAVVGLRSGALCTVDLETLTVLGERDVDHRISTVSLRGELAYVAGYDGVTICDLHDPAAPAPLARLVTFGSAMDVGFYDDLAYVLDSSGTMSVFDVAAPETPMLVALTERDGVRLTIVGNYAFVADGALQVLALHQPESPTLGATLTF